MDGLQLVRLQSRQVLKEGGTMTGSLTMSNSGKFIGNLQGNSDTATKLQTVRTINGTSFDGSVNITTTNWGTARTITIGDSGKSVNGSANISWSLSEIGAAASSHTHSYLPLSGGTITSANFGPLVINRNGSTNAAAITFSNANGTLGSIGMSGTANGGLTRWNTDTTISYTILDTGNYKSIVTPANIGAAATSHTHNYAGSSSAGGAANSALTCTGNSATATKLATARTIALTGAITGSATFDGSGNVSIVTTAVATKGSLSRLVNDVTVATAGTSVSIGISGFNSSTDVMNVYLSGVRLRPAIDYTFTNTTITGANGITFSVGDIVSFEVIKIA